LLSTKLLPFLSQQKERTVSYVRDFLQQPDDNFSPEEKEVCKVVEEFLKNVADEKSENCDKDYFSQVKCTQDVRA
jgi:hypothetical protein